MKSYLHFYSDVEFELRVNSEFIKHCRVNEYCDFEVESGTKFYITFNPISNKIQYLPYTQSIQILDGVPKCNSGQIEIIEFSNNHFEIKLNPIVSTSQTNNLITFNFGKIFTTVQTSPTNIYIYENNVLKKIINSNHCITNSLAKQYGNYIVYKNCLTNGNFQICIVDINSLECVCNLVCETIEEAENKLKFLVRCDSICHYATIYDFNFNDGKLSNNSIYLSKPRNANINELTAYQFLMAIKNNDISQAMTKISPQLQENMSEENISKFFGKIEKIFFDSYNRNDNIYIIITTESTKKIKFTFENNLINDLESF